MMGIGPAVGTHQVTVIGPEVAVVIDTAIHQEGHSGSLGRVLGPGHAVHTKADADLAW